MLHLWTTPILTMRPPVRAALNQNLTQLALETRREFEFDIPLQGKEEVDDYGNNAFYEWQSKGFDNKTRGMDGDLHFKALVKILSKAARTYLKHLGKGHLVPSSGMEIFVWASVHSRGSGHLTHVHPGSLLSGVYFSQVPPSAGRLLLEDPRGPLPPFHDRFTVVPTTGDLVMFPSWLPHQVTSTVSDEPRVSWSFNVLNGDWSHTASLMVSLEA